ncbi:MAG: ubiquinol-cytochrome c reductase iron-sulfur subunit [Planctomycetota bacterium]|nr:MAG: ubiquinol-cytochrome c reductase iron-sulfur subunit [Planctomycetota bacterium]
MAENKKMSTAEILAAARAAKAAKSEAAEAPPPADVTDTPAPKAAAPKPAAAKPAGAAGGRPSVAEIMALARAKKEAEQGGGPATPADPPAPKPAAAKTAVAKAPADKPAVAKAAAPKSLTRDTASILAAARTGSKPGPVSKADAPARPAAVAETASTVVKAPPAKLATAPVLPPKPVKPAAKKGADAEQDRRGFLEMALGSFMATGFTALSMTGGLFGLGLARFMFPNVLAEPPSRFKVGFREGFPSGKVETKYVAQYGVWVVNSDVAGQQQIYALKTVCTHLGCTPNWLEAEQKFKCPCHGSGFYKDGVNFEGPAPRPLERYAIRIADDGQLEIDKGRSYHEELGQWADPESYITV